MGTPRLRAIKEAAQAHIAGEEQRKDLLLVLYREQFCPILHEWRWVVICFNKGNEGLCTPTATQQTKQSGSQQKRTDRGFVGISRYV